MIWLRSVLETGSFTPADFQRFERPFAYTSESERYQFAAWDVPRADGTRESGVRVTTRNPGGLHTYMLGMGDAWNGTTNLTKGASPLWGMGRVKLRHPSQFGLYGHDFRSFVFTGSTPIKFFVGNTPLAGAADLLKCVVVQHEDMSHKTDIGELRLDVRLRAPSRGGGCSSSMAEFGHGIDDTRDTKKMLAFRSSAGQVGQCCAEVTIAPQTLPSTGSMWVQSFCYVADEYDNDPN